MGACVTRNVNVLYVTCCGQRITTAADLSEKDISKLHVSFSVPGGKGNSQAEDEMKDNQ